jgi:uncharacterized glyoxalase superfamily protein PhnB
VAHIGTIALVVGDYDEAIAYFVVQLGFLLLSDLDQGGGKRWVTVAPSADAQTTLLLAKAVTPEQTARIGDQTGGRVFLFLETADFDSDYARLLANGVTFLETPRSEPYGKVAVFQDHFGNRWDLLQRSR